MPAIETGRQQFKAERRLTTQTKPYGELNNRDILQELLSWEVIESTPAEVADADKTDLDGNSCPKVKLLGKFDKYMHEKEDQNLLLHQNIQQWKKTTFKNKKQA